MDSHYYSHSRQLQHTQLHNLSTGEFPDYLEVFWHKPEPTGLFLLRNTPQVCFLRRGSVKGHSDTTQDPGLQTSSPGVHTTVLLWYPHRGGHCPGPAPGSAVPECQHKYKNSSWLWERHGHTWSSTSNTRPMEICLMEMPNPTEASHHLVSKSCWRTKTAFSYPMLAGLMVVKWTKPYPPACVYAHTRWVLRAKLQQHMQRFNLKTSGTSVSHITDWKEN